MTTPTPTLLTGFAGTATVKLAGSDYKCVINSWSAQFSKTFYSQQTFCSGPYRTEAVGMYAFDATLNGFLNEGDAISDPLANFAGAAVAFVLQASTNSMFTGTGHIQGSASAAANDVFGLSYSVRSTGSFATVWKTTP